MRFALMVGLVMILTAVAAVEAQTSRAPRGSLDVALVGAQPTGDFGLIVDVGSISDDPGNMAPRDRTHGENPPAQAPAVPHL